MEASRMTISGFGGKGSNHDILPPPRGSSIIYGSEHRKSFMAGQNPIQNPCDPQPKKVMRIRKVRANPTGREHIRLGLKMEKTEFQNEFIEYNVEIPIRVALRLEYLMGSTKVNLNDKNYLTKLLKSLERQEEEDVVKVQKAREAIEKKRVKKLVVDGEMPPPPDLVHLYNHPVFKVNAMLRRLAEHDKVLYAVPKPDTEIIPVEPYEYNGDKFFQHLHRFGTTDYVPYEVVRAEKKKLMGKIKRAKERLRIKRQAEADRDADLDILFKNTGAEEDEMAETTEVAKSLSVAPSEYEGATDDFDDELTGSRGSRASFGDSSPEERKRRKQEAWQKKKEMIEKAQIAKEDRELKFLLQQRDLELEQKRLERERHLNEQRRKKEKLERTKRAEEDRKYREMLEEKAARRASLPPELANIFKNLSATNLLKQPVKETLSQKYLRQAYLIPENTDLKSHLVDPNPIMRTLDEKGAKNIRDMFDFSLQVKELYQREQAATDEFLKKLNRPQTQKRHF